VHNFLWGAYAEEELAKRDSDMVKPIRRPLPGTNMTAEETRIRAEVDSKLAHNMEAFLYRDRLTAAEKTVFLGKQTCGECHSYERSGENAVPERIIPPQVPEVWFKHALFDHAAHQALDCLACHAAAPTSRESKDVLLPGIEICKQCHSPPGNRDGKIRGGARFDCTECHRYHHGAVSLQGTGPAKPRITAKRDIEQFLSGKVTNP
jgi:hypothetical protein